MAKKQITNYKFVPGTVSPDTNLYSNAFTLLDLNKKFIQEEAIAYIAYNVANNIAPFTYYTYNAEKCRRDISYILEGYLSDLRHGGNQQTVHNASKYFEYGIAQIDGDRSPEVAAHTFILGLIQNFIFANVAFSNRQTTVAQVIDNTIVAETAGETAITTLANIIINVITNGITSLPTATAYRGYIKFPGYYKLKDILLVTNTTRNIIMYNFADASAKAEITYSENYDSDFPAALYGTEKITTLTFDTDTSTMMVTDQIQIFAESKEQAVRLNPIANDAMERMKVGIPQSMLDADFEYGLQPTKWQAISFMRGYPSVYEIPGSDLAVTSVTTDASASTGNTGASLITVNTSNPHGLLVNNVFTIKALANSISGFSRAEGTFLVNSATSTSFTYYSKSKVGTSNGQQLSSTYTQLRKAGYYTGAGAGNPTFSVFSAGSSGSVTTKFVTAAGKDIIGFTGSAPPIGAPITGSGIPSGAQVTAVVGAAGASTTVTVTADIGDTSLIVDNTTGINAGMIIDRGDGVSVQVTGIEGNTISLNGALTSSILGSTESYTSLPQAATTGVGTGSIFTVSRSGSSYLTTVTNPGTGHIAGDIITIYGSSLGGTNGTNNASITVSSASARNTVATFNNASITSGSTYNPAAITNLATTGGTGTGLRVDVTLDPYDLVSGVTVNTPGSGYTVGDTVKITSGITRGVVVSLSQTNEGSGYTTTTGVVPTGGTGTGLVVNLTAGVSGGVKTYTLTSGGTGYSNASNVATTGGTGTGFNLYATSTSGGVVTNAFSGAIGSGYTVGDVVTISGGGGNATITITAVTDRNILSINPTSYGTGYTIGDVLTIPGGTGGQYTVANATRDIFVNVATVNTGGLIQSVTTAGTPISSPSKAFFGALTISDVTTASVADSTTLTYSAIATIQITFASPHGFIPGDTITVQITSTDTGAQLAAGAYFVEQVPTTSTIRYTARTSGTIANTLTGNVYARPDSYFIHRPFDGGVQLGTASASHGAGAVRMSKKYIRYQSGKGVMYNTGALFAPSYDIQSLTSTGTTVGSVITLTTDDVDHGCQVGAQITISGATTSGYNGVYTVADIITERKLGIVATQVLGGTTAELGNPCQMSIRVWHGSTVRAGIFDEQNGMFWQYDGMKMAVGRRSSTFQVAGVISVPSNSNLVTGTNTRFRSQLTAGDRVVVRGMTHVISQILSDTSLTITPDYRGVTDGVGVKICKVQDIIIPQEQWNLDPCNGSGPSGYNIDVTKMQMIGIQHTWYGAGFVDFMLRGGDGNYVFVHRFRNSNVNTEAYMRTGNQPVRYEVINEGARDRLSADIDATTTIIPLGTTYWFPNSGTVIIDGEMIRYTGRTTTALTGCARSAQTVVFQSGSQRTFTGGDAAAHTSGTGVILVSNTITPNISHWGSAFMIDGQFDEDRGYIFNYAATGISASVEKVTAFLMRLAPSVSNAQVGDLGEKELLNRAQLLLSSIACVSDTVSGGGGIVIEGVLNPINYPEDPTKITWTGLSTQAAGGQPSFAQIAAGGSVAWGGGASTSTATIQGAFTTTLVAKSFSSITNSLTATGFNSVTRTANAVGFASTTQALTALGVTATGVATNALLLGRNTVVISRTAYNALTTPLIVGDGIIFSGYTGSNLVSAVSVGATYVQITMNAAASVTSAGTTSIAGTLTSSVAATYASALSTARTDFLITTAQYDSQFTDTALAATDPLSVATYLTGGQRVSSWTRAYTTIAGVSYSRIIMNAAATATSPGGSSLTVTFTSSVAATYNLAISTIRNDFLVPATQFTTAIKVNDILSAVTYLAGGQTLSSFTNNYTTISGTAYARVVMSGLGTVSSSGGSNVTVTATSADTTTYAAALNSGRTDFLITDTAYDASGILVGDVLSVATFLTGSQTILSITRSYTTISSVNYTRIVMSAVANSTSTTGSGNDITVTLTAAGSAATYVRTNYLFFTSSTWIASGANVSTKVATDQTSFAAGTSVAAISTRTFGATTVYRVTFTQTSNATLSAAGTLKFQFGANYALPGEQVFSFVSNPGSTDSLNLEALKELTSTAIGGRGTFPNGPDVLAINIYKVSGTATPANIIIRWGEAQA
jgi:hypothetical protein